MAKSEKQALKKTYQLALLLCCFFLAMLISYIRYLTGPELALSLFFLFPIVFVTWNVGFWAGILISISSAISWLIADVMMPNAFSSVFIPYINETFRLIVFLIITYTVNQLQTTLENHKELADTDPMTLLSNRRAFYNIANMELKKAHRYLTPISVLYMDLDNFKEINDHFGHVIGDTLLHSAAATLKNNVRSIDNIARFGGDEFVILFSETGAESAKLVTQKIEMKLHKLMSDNHWPVTFSMGVVTFETLPESVEEIIKEADAQMYLAKKMGKNRIQYKIVANDATFRIPLVHRL